MKTIGFIGAFDKIDIMLNIAKILTLTKNKVLVIDATILQKARYIVPVINPTKSYITTFEDIDVAVGFEKIEDIKRYLAIASNEGFEYDNILIDCDNAETFEAYNLKDAEIKYFTTSFGLYSLKRGLEIISQTNQHVVMKKLLFSRYMSNEEDQYLNFLSNNIKIDWVKEKIYFPFEEGDLHINIENQLSEKIKLKELSDEYKEGMMYVCEEILRGKINFSEIKRIVKSL